MLRIIFYQILSLQHSSEKIDPRRHMFESKEADIMNLLFAASNGDLSAVKRHWLGGQGNSLYRPVLNNQNFRNSYSPFTIFKI